jgi:PAS domain-containing protein
MSEPVTNIIDRHVKEGRTHYTRGNLAPIIGDGGKVIGVQATSVDITELMEAQERLRQSEQFHRAVMEATDAGAAQYDLVS